VEKVLGKEKTSERNNKKILFLQNSIKSPPIDYVPYNLQNSINIKGTLKNKRLLKTNIF
jgi:hypothetical protein